MTEETAVPEQRMTMIARAYEIYPGDLLGEHQVAEIADDGTDVTVKLDGHPDQVLDRMLIVDVHRRLDDVIAAAPAGADMSPLHQLVAHARGGA